jgi:hypothetical protein
LAKIKNTCVDTGPGHWVDNFSNAHVEKVHLEDYQKYVHICMEVNRINKGSSRCNADRQIYWQNQHQPAGMQA